MVEGVRVCDSQGKVVREMMVRGVEGVVGVMKVDRR